MSLGRNNLTHVNPGDPITDNIGSAAFINTIIDAIKGPAGLLTQAGLRTGDETFTDGVFPATEEIQFLPVDDHDTPELTGTATALILQRRLFSAIAEDGITTETLVNLDYPRLRATLKRGNGIYTTGDSYSDGRAPFYAYPVGTVPVPLVATDSAPSPWVVGLPCGREENGTRVQPGRGGLICVRAKDAKGIVWAILDTTNIWVAKVTVGSTEAFAGDPLTEWQDISAAFVAPYRPGTTTAEALNELEETIGIASIRYRGVGGTILAGSYINISWVNDEWIILGDTGGTGGSGSGDCCCCESVTVGDVIEYSGDIFSTFFRVLCKQLGDITHKQPNGVLTISFPPPLEMILEKQDDVDFLEWEIPSTAFTGFYSDGDAVEPADMLTPTGKVSFIHSIQEGVEGPCNCPKQRLRVEWEAEIPVKPVPEPEEPDPIPAP